MADLQKTNLDRNLTDLHKQVQSGSISDASITANVHTEAGWATAPPLAIAALEDKIVQRAVAAVLNAIYGEELPRVLVSGFRPLDAARMMRWTRSV